MPRIRIDRVLLAVLTLATAGPSAHAQTTREIAAACLESTLDDLPSFGSLVPVDCPALSEAYGDRDTWVSLAIVGLGGTIQSSTDLPFSCGGGQLGTSWENDGDPVDADATFVASGHDTAHDVVYGLLSNESHFQSFEGPFEAVRFVVPDRRLERLGVSCLSVAVVESANAWVCDHGRGTSTVGSLDLAARLPTTTDVATFPVSMNDIEQRAFELGRGVVLVRAGEATLVSGPTFRALALPVSNPPSSIPDRVTLDTSRAGGLVDLGLLVDGPFLVARLALLQGLRGDGGIDGTVTRSSVLELREAGASAVVPDADVTARVTEAASRLGLDAVRDDELVLGAVWSAPDGAVVAPLRDASARYRAAGEPLPRSLALRFRRSTASFLVEVVTARDAAATVERVLTPPNAHEYRWSRRDVGDTTHLAVETTATTIGPILARLLSVPMRTTTEARLRRAESRIAARIRRGPRPPSEAEVVAACDEPNAALRGYRFDLLADRYDDCVDLGSTDAFADTAFAERFLDRAIDACRSGNDAGCRVLNQLSYMFGDYPHDELMLIDRRVCESRGGVTCLPLADEDPRDAAALRAVRDRCDRGVAADCVTLVARAEQAEASSSTLEALRTRACDVGDAGSCSVSAQTAARACESPVACDAAAALALHACELGSADACLSLRIDVGHTRHSGVPSGPRSPR